MATEAEAQQAILDTILANASRGTLNESQGRAILSLAEAWAWLEYPAQPHGGSATSQD